MSKGREQSERVVDWTVLDEHDFVQLADDYLAGRLSPADAARCEAVDLAAAAEPFREHLNGYADKLFYEIVEPRGD